MRVLWRQQCCPRAGNGSQLAVAQALRLLRRERRETARDQRSEEHTSELQSHSDLVCRLLLEKKKTDHADRPDPGAVVVGRQDEAERPQVRVEMFGAYHVAEARPLNATLFPYTTLFRSVMAAAMLSESWKRLAIGGSASATIVASRAERNSERPTATMATHFLRSCEAARPT